MILAGLIAPAVAEGQAATSYPPPREGIAAAVATLNVDSQMLDTGAAIFAEQCSGCHGTDGSGNGPLRADLSAKPKNLRDAALMNPLSDMRLADVVRYGGFEMPAFSAIRGERLIALTAYVRSLSFPDLREIELQPLTQGSVPDYTPVTNTLLQAPDQGDWLMYRRTYNAWGYSPLTEINRDNVSSLQLAWSLAMEPGEQETTPLVHDGVMYIVHPGDVIQALDATNGDLIWEYRREKVATGQTRMRIIAI